MDQVHFQQYSHKVGWWHTFMWKVIVSNTTYEENSLLRIALDADYLQS